MVNGVPPKGSNSHFAGTAGILAGNLPGFTGILTAGKDSGAPSDGKMRIAGPKVNPLLPILGWLVPGIRGC
jgi:hypothetical protein